MLALHGQGRYDRVPAGDLGYLKLVGRLTTGHPNARADEAEVRGFFERYGEWEGLAGTYLPSPPARACSRQRRVDPRVQPLARQELVGQRPCRVRRPLEQLAVDIQSP